jgi:hypothetical protein
LRALPMAAVFVVFVVSGVRGVDFGIHWDEDEAQMKPVRDMISTGILMPRASGYPSFSKFITLQPTLPTGIKTWVKTKGNPRAVQAAMLAKFDEPTFKLTVRRFYVVVSALTIIWVWAAVLALRRPWWEAAAAAAAVGLCWEFAYHARWVATDCPLVQFSALTLLMLALYFRTRKPAWLYAAAVAAGLATGTKYQGIVLLVPLVLAGALTQPLRPLRRQIFRAAALPAVAFAAFLVTTPNLIYEPFGTVEEFQRIAKYYETGHWGYSVSGAGQHFKLVLIYLSVSFFSPFTAVAVAMFACTLVGAVILVRSDRRLGAVLVCLPIVLLLMFCGRYRAMIIRNYLLIAPFLALFAARGLSEIGARFPRRWLRYVLAGATTFAFVAGGVWLIIAGESIRHPDPNDQVRRAIAYVGKHPRKRFKLSPQVTAIAKAQKFPIPANAQAETGADQMVLFLRAEGGDLFARRTNDPWLFKAVFGPHDVNLNWYSTWNASDRVVVMTVEKAKWAKIALAN